MKVARFINRFKIGVRLNVILSSVMIVLFLVLGLYTVRTIKAKAIVDADARLLEQIEDLSSTLRDEIFLNQKRVNLGMQFTREYLNGFGSVKINQREELQMEVTNQATKEKTSVSLNTWFLNGEQIQESNYLVDEIGERTEGTATIFQRIPQGYVRVSTNVKYKDGKRAVGTYIPNDSPVAQAISAGKEYHGRAFVVDAWYLTAYTPLVIDGQVEGIIYFGIKEKNLLGLKKIFKGKSYFNRGYPYLVTSKGDAVIHPTKEGQNILEYSFVKEMLSNKEHAAKLVYDWEGGLKVQYSSYIDEVDSYIAVTAYEEDVMEAVNKIQNAIILVVFIGIIVFVLISSLISRNISRSLNKSVQFAEALANGDLDYTIDVDQEDEVGILAKAMTQMSYKLKEVISSIKEGSSNISSASQQLSSASQQISQGASEQASSTEEVFFFNGGNGCQYPAECCTFTTGRENCHQCYRHRKAWL